MKKVAILLSLALLMLTSCADDKTFQNPIQKETEHRAVHVETYGIFNTDTKVAGVDYNANVGNIIWSVVLCETIVVPVILCGWFLFEPVEVINPEIVFAKDQK